MNRLEKLFSLICSPNPQVFPDESEAASVLLKNRFIFGVHLTIIFLQMCSYPFCEFTFEVNCARCAVQFTMLGIFLIFCRSFPQIGRTLNAILTNLIALRISFSKVDGAYSGLILAYGVPSLVFYLTQSVHLTGISGIIQLIIAMVSYRTNLAEIISLTDPHEFAERFATNFMIISVPLQLLNLYAVYRLNKKTDEHAAATRKAEESLEQQKIFVYSFSHEMRNPMNSLLGNLDLALMSQAVAPELREMIGTAKVCGVLLLNLINTVLDAGKLGLGKLEVNPAPTRVHEVLQRVWGISHDLMAKKGLKSHLKISKQVPTRLMLDSHRMNQVLMNLIGNATKFTEQGLITISISWLLNMGEVSDECFMPIPYDDESEGLFEKDYNLYALKRMRSKDNQKADESLILSGAIKEFNLEGVSQPLFESKGILKIIIKDSGCGMNEEEISKLFQKFSQVGQVTSKRQIGTGLGLFISKELIENMGGQIRVYSKPEVGSTFIICLPTLALPGTPQQQCPLHLNERLIPKLKSKKIKAIVADDSSFNVSLVCNFYSKIGVEVLATASNGRVAYEKYLEMVRANRVDVVTLDIDMPIMDGKQACEKIRQYEKENNLKRSIIILISGNYEEEDMRNLLEKGEGNNPDCFLKKPLVFEELCWALDKYT